MSTKQQALVALDQKYFGFPDGEFHKIFAEHAKNTAAKDFFTNIIGFESAGRMKSDQIALEEYVGQLHEAFEKFCNTPAKNRKQASDELFNHIGQGAHLYPQKNGNSLQAALLEFKKDLKDLHVELVEDKPVRKPK